MPAARPRFRLHSIAFAWPGARDAIPLRDPQSGNLAGVTPEWNGKPRAPAAYVRGSRPTVRVQVTGPSGARATARISATGTGGPGISGRTVKLAIGANGISAPIDLRLAGALPKRAGVWTIRWKWTIVADRVSRLLGRSKHEVITTWKVPLDPASWLPRGEAAGPAAVPARPWVYLPIARWTSEWVGSANNPREICDAIIGKMKRSKLRYYVAAHDVRDMLLQHGGMCGGFYKMFQAMAGAQGVFVHRRCYMVNWRALRDEEARWCAIVVTAGGLGHRQPPVPAQAFHDVDAEPMLTAPVRVHRSARRYSFWGAPGIAGDGHCINILEHRGKHFLYDASFDTKSVQLEGFVLPKVHARRAQRVTDQGTFKSAYLDHAVAYMLGSVRRPDGFYRTIIPGVGESSKAHRIHPGLTVRTRTVDIADGNITFFWGP